MACALQSMADGGGDPLVTTGVGSVCGVAATSEVDPKNWTSKSSSISVFQV